MSDAQERDAIDGLGERAADPLPPERRRYAVPVVLFFALFLTFAYFYHLAPGWNVASRLDLTYAMVELGTFSIDRYHDRSILETNDKAKFAGHFYCDKSPALSFLGVPVYYLLWQAKMRWGLLADRPNIIWIHATRYVVRVAAVSFPAALLGVILWSLARRFGASDRQAFALSAGLLCGTFLFGYATLFFPYLPAGLCTMAAYALLLGGRLRDSDSGADACRLSRGPRLFWAGLLLGLGWFLELTVGLIGIGLGGYALWAARRKPLALWKFIAGGLIPVAFFFAYTHHIFGEFAIPYKYEADDFFRAEMAKGFQGIHIPRIGVLYYITVHPFQGIFFYSPFLLLWFAGLWEGLKGAKGRFFLPDVLLSTYVVAAFLAFNSGYYLWWGGWAAGPRHLNPAIPFFLVPLAIWFGRSRPTRNLIFYLLLAVSILFHLMITTVDPQPPPGVDDSILMAAKITDNLPSPILEQIVPIFFSDDVIGRNLVRVFVGIKSRFALAPLGLLWLGVIIWLRRPWAERPLREIRRG